MIKKNGVNLSVLIFLSVIFLLEESYAQTNPIVLKYDFPGPTIAQSVFTYDGISYGSILMEPLYKHGKPGEPVIPFRTVRILIPQDSEPEHIEVTTGEKIILDGKYRIEFGKTPQPLRLRFGSVTETKPSKEIYSSAVVFPGKLYSQLPLQNFRGYKILILNLYPVQYIPKEGLLSYFSNMTVKVHLKPVLEISPLFRNLPKDKAEVIKEVDNPYVVNSYTKKVEAPHRGCICDPCESYDYVIITSDALKNSSTDPNFQDLINSKNQKGIKATIVTIEDIENDLDYRWDGTYGDDSNFFDDTAAHIRNFIKDAYINWRIEYVLLGGDGDGDDVGGESGHNIIPARKFYAFTAYPGNPDNDNRIPADLYYAALHGNWNNDTDSYWGESGEEDFEAEVYIGRAPVDSEQEVSNFVMKTMAYERSRDPYLREAWMVGEDLKPGWGGDDKDEIKMRFPKGFNIGTLYDRDYDGNNWPKSKIISIINDGTYLINHLGHSRTLWNMKLCNAEFDEGLPGPYGGVSGDTDVDDLTNTKYCFIYSQGCYPGAFDNWHFSYPAGHYEEPYNQAYGGGYTRNDCIAEHFVTSEHGAFAIVMNSRDGWLGYSQNYDREFWDAIFSEGFTNIGKANQDSKQDNEGLVGEDHMKWCYYALNLLGDPELEIYSPKDLVGYWMLDEGSGQIAYDSSVYGNNGTLGDSNTVEDSDPNWFEDTVHGWCLHFDGNDKVTLSSPIPTLQSRYVTISAWIKVGHEELQDSEWYPIVTQYDNSEHGYYFYLYGKNPALWLNTTQAVSDEQISTAEWHHLAGTYNNFQLKIYVNGILKDTQDLESNSGVDTNAYIGHDHVTEPSTYRYFTGYIDDMRIYNYVLDANEIWDLSYISPADFDKDEFVNFIDYAMFANAWQSSTGQPDYNDIFDLEDDDVIDYADLALFCKDWLWQAGWNQTMEAMMMGMAGGMGQDMTESTSLTEELPQSVSAKQQPIDVEPLDIEEILNWLAEVWLDPEVQEAISEADWLKFTESLKSELK